MVKRGILTDERTEFASEELGTEDFADYIRWCIEENFSASESGGQDPIGEADSIRQAETIEEETTLT